MSSASKRDIRLQISLLLPLVMMIVFTLARVAIWLGNAAFFASLSSGEITSAFLHGLQFDFYMTALLMGPFILLLNLPVKSTKWPKIWVTVLLVELIFITGFLVADYIYFPNVGRHIAEEIIQVSNDWGYVVSYAVTQLWWALLLLFAGLGIALHYIYKYISANATWGRTRKQTILTLVCILLLVVLGIRGHLGRGKSLGVADVYNYAQSSAGAALTLNGAFTAYQVGRKGTQEFTNNFPLEQAIAFTQRQLIAAQENVPEASYPLMRQRTQVPAVAFSKKPNILIVLLEGWPPQYIDAIGHKNFKVTPVFDEIVKNGIVFSNAYAAGQRSIFGFAAVLGSIPLIPGLPMFGYGLEMASLSPFPKHFAQAGYYTFFAQTSHRDSYRLCALASYLGVQDSYGWEDIPERFNYNEKAPFGYDYDAMQFAADQIAKHKDQPFMGMIFTGITHEPFISTLSQFDIYPNDTWEHGFLNSLAYADWSIGELLKRAKQEGWFNDTIFVFVADHTSGPREEGTLKRNFHIPLVVYAPKHYAARQIDYVVSQLDIAPTLYNMAGLTPVYTAFGRDMFDAAAPHLAMVAEGSNIGLITDKGAIRHTGTKLLTVEPYTDDFDVQQAQSALLALNKTAYTLLKENRWYNPHYEVSHGR